MKSEHWGKFRMLNKQLPFFFFFPCSVSISVTLLLLSLFFFPFSLFHTLHIPITPGPLLSPSETVASWWGGSKVLIGITLG